MAKVHITLVGGQPMPVYNGIKCVQPDKVVFIYSEQTQHQMINIKNEFHNGAIQFEETEPLDSLHLQKIAAAALHYKEKFKDDDITLNISGGTKTWSYVFAKVFDDVDTAKIFYIDQNNKVYHLKDEFEFFPISFDMFVQFRLNDNPLNTYIKLSKYTAKDFEVALQIEKFRKVDIGIFTDITNIEQNKLNQPSGTNKNKKGTSYAKWEKNNQITLYIEKPKKQQTLTVESPHAKHIVFNAGWFEIKVAQILSQWQPAENIYLNCKFTINNNILMENIKKKFPKNEVDIIVDTGTKLLFVECKTNIAKSIDIDKFNSVVKNYGGTGSKALFVVLNNFKEADTEKIENYSMISYSFSDNHIQHLDVHPLIAKLQSHIGVINK